MTNALHLMWTDTYQFIPMQVFSEWLEFRSWGIVDVAITCKHIRTSWLNALVSFDGASHRSFPHGDLSLRWMIMRKIQTSSIYLHGFVDLWCLSPDRGYLRSCETKTLNLLLKELKLDSYQRENIITVLYSLLYIVHTLIY